MCTFWFVVPNWTTMSRVLKAASTSFRSTPWIIDLDFDSQLNNIHNGFETYLIFFNFPIVIDLMSNYDRMRNNGYVIKDFNAARLLATFPRRLVALMHPGYLGSSSIHPATLLLSIELSQRFYFQYRTVFFTHHTKRLPVEICSLVFSPSLNRILTGLCERSKIVIRARIDLKKKEKYQIIRAACLRI